MTTMNATAATEHVCNLQLRLAEATDAETDRAGRVTVEVGAFQRSR